MIKKPLAYRIRPTSIKDVIGQEHLVSKNGLLFKSIENKNVFSMILFGPPGCGKTTIAEAFAKSINIRYFKLNAVTSNKKDLETAIEEAKLFPQAFLIIDEVHRLNKDKQDILLPYIEDGTVYLIGMTTQNPYMAINKALRSRCQLLEVKPLTEENIIDGLKRAIKSPDGLNNEISIDDKSLKYIAKLTGGDMRYALNYLDVLKISIDKKNITLEDTKKILQIPNWQMDENENEHYDSVSALQKSIRGSDVDAALYYLSRLCIVQDLDSIIRRLTITAYEDIGIGNPQAVDRVINACKTAEMVGFPEAIIPLGFAVVDLSLSPKSKQSTLAVEKAIEYATKYPLNVMDYLKLTPVNLQEEDKYPYDRPDLWEKIQYLPEQIKNIQFYFPHEGNSNYEKALNENYKRLKSIKRTSNLRQLKSKK